ncbi:MAG: anaerobic sulfatase maturase [Candidatus Aminicenantes bacterium]|nr:anaerobic sulfatase maturase [Candidatus Aminicenantes bacterium]
MPKKSAHPFHVIVKPIGAVCNLNCQYCYYLDKKDLYPQKKSFRMPLAVLEEFTKQYILCQPDSIQEIHFAWQGGEPSLLGLDFFKKAVAFQKEYAPQGVNIANSFQTNGTLLDDDWGQFFHDESFLIGISLDGPEAIHDRFRTDSQGKGSFQQAMKGLEILKKHKVEFNTLTVVNSYNGNQPQKVYEFLKQSGSTFFQFIPIVETDEKGSITKESVGPRQWGRFLQTVFDSWLSSDIGRIFVQRFDVCLGLHMGLLSSLCVFSETCGRAAALEHNGDLYSCDHFVFKEYHLGNIAEQNLTSLIDSEKQKKFGKDKKDSLPKQCQKCHYLSVCNGGCPANRLDIKTGEPFRLNHLCEGYKLFFSHSRPYFKAMAKSLHAGNLAKDYPLFLKE